MVDAVLKKLEENAGMPECQEKVSSAQEVPIVN
jgi:hypothetical protein